MSGNIGPRESEELAALLFEAEIARARARGYLDALIATSSLPSNSGVSLRASITEGGAVPSLGGQTKACGVAVAPPYNKGEGLEKKRDGHEDKQRGNLGEGTQSGVEGIEQRERLRDSIPANLPESRFP